jgi:DNA helicase II / ATP-dependent DNA helicase PcrA
MSRFSEIGALAREPVTAATPAERLSSILAGLTPRQAEAAALTGAVLVLAGAGTGKTRTLAACS